MVPPCLGLNRSQGYHLAHSFYRRNDTLLKAKTFQGGFRNANGKPRREKVLLNLRQQDNVLGRVDFS